MHFLWTPDLETGNQFIDNDHHVLIERINSVMDAISRGHASDIVADTLGALQAYTREHFSREQAEMRRIAYAETKSHMIEHSVLLNQVDDLKAQYDSGKRIAALNLFNLLSPWLRHHILQVDMKLADALRQV